MIRRWDPIGTFSGVSGAGLRFAHATSPIPSTASATPLAARPGERTAPSSLLAR
jgi:hypothetical protein